MKAHTRNSDPATSREAAASVNVTAGQRRVIEAFAQHGPMTDEDLVARLPDLSPSGARSRRAELVAKGVIAGSGGYRVGATGRKMIVWRLAPAPTNKVSPIREEARTPTDGPVWVCLTCGSPTTVTPPDTTVDPTLRSGRCVGKCAGKSAIFRQRSW